MATVKIHAPNSAFTGVVAGVAFAKGTAEVDPKANAAALAYFRRRGYGVGARAKAEAATPENRVDARQAATQVVGTPLRDAAVDPAKDDFLAPVNAGKADPHGPQVVSPEIHHEGPKGIKPGDVHVGAPAEQEADEKALAEAVLIQRQRKTDAIPAASDEPSGAPARSASKAAWRDYAVARGMDPDEAESATRADLIERYGGEG